jgi:hypothetical protein
MEVNEGRWRRPADRIGSMKVRCKSVGLLHLALATGDVVRQLAERRAPQLVMAASAEDQKMTHAPALRGCFPCWRADAGLPPDRLRSARRYGVPETGTARVGTDIFDRDNKIYDNRPQLQLQDIDCRSPRSG